MSVSEIARFTEDVKNDAALLEEVKSITGGIDEITAFANSKGYSFTAEELKQEAEKAKGALTEEQLDKIAGGGAGAVAVVVVGGVTVAVTVVAT